MCGIICKFVVTTTALVLLDRSSKRGVIFYLEFYKEFINPPKEVLKIIEQHDFAILLAAIDEFNGL